MERRDARNCRWLPRDKAEDVRTSKYMWWAEGRTTGTSAVKKRTYKRSGNGWSYGGRISDVQEKYREAKRSV